MLGKTNNMNTICKQNCCCVSDNQGHDIGEKKHCDNEKKKLAIVVNSIVFMCNL